MSNNIYYVYQYYDPIRKEPIYIGEGKGGRYRQHLLKVNKHPFIQRIQWIRKQGKEPIVSLIKENLTETQALKLEGILERKIGRKNIGSGPLLNLKPCGLKGTTGLKWTTKQKRNRCGENNPMFGKIFSTETRQKMSSSRSGIKHFMFGKHLSNKQKNKIRHALIGKKQSKETIEKKRKANSKKYKIIFPNGCSEQIVNLNNFCKNNNLNSCSMYKLAKETNKKKNYRGFKCLLLTNF